MELRSRCRVLAGVLCAASRGRWPTSSASSACALGRHLDGGRDRHGGCRRATLQGAHQPPGAERHRPGLETVAVERIKSYAGNPPAFDTMSRAGNLSPHDLQALRLAKRCPMAAHGRNLGAPPAERPASRRITTRRWCASSSTIRTTTSCGTPTIRSICRRWFARRALRPADCRHRRRDDAARPARAAGGNRRMRARAVPERAASDRSGAGVSGQRRLSGKSAADLSGALARVGVPYTPYVAPQTRASNLIKSNILPIRNVRRLYPCRSRLSAGACARSSMP